MAKQARLGSGKRFEKLKNKLAHEKGIRDPAAVVAAAGREKYGNKKMASLAKAGKKK